MNRESGTFMWDSINLSVSVDGNKGTYTKER